MNKNVKHRRARNGFIAKCRRTALKLRPQSEQTVSGLGNFSTNPAKCKCNECVCWFVWRIKMLTLDWKYILLVFAPERRFDCRVYSPYLHRIFKSVSLLLVNQPIFLHRLLSIAAFFLSSTPAKWKRKNKRKESLEFPQRFDLVLICKWYEILEYGCGRCRCRRCCGCREPSVKLSMLSAPTY